jgi:SAM-dependent MidA family methyltransferase
VPSAAKQLGAAIAAAGGVIPFSQFMQISLYGENGFYTNSGKAGRRGGDFITSPEVGPLFGTVIARYLDECWQKLGSPTKFDVVSAALAQERLHAAFLLRSHVAYRH